MSTVDCGLHTVDCAFFYPRALARRVILLKVLKVPKVPKAPTAAMTIP